MKVAALISGNANSIYSVYLAKKFNNEVVCLINLQPEKQDAFQLYMPNSQYVFQQAEAMELPLISLPTSGILQEEVFDLRSAIDLAVQKHKIQGVVHGLLAAETPNQYLNSICSEFNLKPIGPIWYMNALQYLQGLVLHNFEVVITRINSEGFNSSMLGKKLDRNVIYDIVKISKTKNISLGGENGEYNTFVTDCPLFKKKLKIFNGEAKMETPPAGKYLIRELMLVNK